MPHIFTKTEDGSDTLTHAIHGETFHSTAGAWSECRAVYLEPFLKYSTVASEKNWSVLDVGFGLGLNWLTYVDYFLSRSSVSDSKLSLVSVENDSSLLDLDLSSSQIGELSGPYESMSLLRNIKTERHVESRQVQAEIILDDLKNALQHLIERNQKFDVILHDAFSPKNNPDCWSKECFESLARCCKINSMLLTYSVAGEVRRQLTSAGFEVKKIPGFGKKREQLLAIYCGTNL